MLLGASLATWAARAGYETPAPHRRWLEEALVAARDALGTGEYAAVWERGTNLDLPGALTAAAELLAAEPA